MRPTIILASFAVTLLAAPVPVTEDQVARAALIESKRPNGAEFELGKRGYRTNNARAVDFDIQARGYRANNPRAEEEVEKRGYRANNPRSEDIESRGYRTNNARSENDVEKRDYQTNNVRSEDEDEVEVDKRGYRAINPRSEDGELNTKRSVSVSQREVEIGERSNAIRSVWDGVGRIVEAVRTRGFNSASLPPAREPM